MQPTLPTTATVALLLISTPAIAAPIINTNVSFGTSDVAKINEQLASSSSSSSDSKLPATDPAPKQTFEQRPYRAASCVSGGDCGKDSDGRQMICFRPEGHHRGLCMRQQISPETTAAGSENSNKKAEVTGCRWVLKKV